MNKPTLYSRKTNFINSIKFKIPPNGSICDLKIRNLRFFSKILPCGNIAIYGNYEILILYNIYLPNNRFKNASACRKVKFYKILKTNYSIKNKYFKSSINFITTPRCLFSIYRHKNSKFHLGLNNFCKVYLFSPLFIMLLDNNNQKLLYYEDNNTCKDSIPKEIIKKKRLIEANTIVGKGCVDLYIEKDLDIPSFSPPIWKIDNITITINISDLNIINENVITSGFAIINIDYITSIYYSNGTTTGNFNYMQVKIPFSTPINLITEPNIKIKNTDNCQLIKSECLEETHKLKDASTTTSGEVVYNKVTEQFIIQIKVIATRKEKLYI